MRCFVAVELSPALREPLLRLLRDLPRLSEVRWCTEDQLHVTLKFLGEVADVQLPAVSEVLKSAAVAVEPFSIQLGGLGGFPSPRSPRVVWCGLADPTRGCARWVERADPRLGELGFPREERAFTPHITLGRSKSRGGSAALGRVLEGAMTPPAVEMQVTDVVLFESRLGPQGAQYYPLMKVPLGAG